MGAADIGISESDFTNNALSDFGMTVVRTPRTKNISNTTGSPTYTNGTNEDITVVFTKRVTGYQWDKEGLVEQGDAFMMVDKDQTINKEDLITVDGETFRVDTVILRTPGGLDMFKSCVLFLVD
jgi:hypothetical protein